MGGRERFSDLARAYYDHHEAIAAGRDVFEKEIERFLGQTADRARDGSSDPARVKANAERVKRSWRLGRGTARVALRLRWSDTIPCPKLSLEVESVAPRTEVGHALPADLLDPDGLPRVDEDRLRSDAPAALWALWSAGVEHVEASLEVERLSARVLGIDLLAGISGELVKLVEQGRLKGAKTSRKAGEFLGNAGWPAYFNWSTKVEGKAWEWDIVFDSAASSEAGDRRALLLLAICYANSWQELLDRHGPGLRYREGIVLIDWSDRLAELGDHPDRLVAIATEIVEQAREKFEAVRADLE